MQDYTEYLGELYAHVIDIMYITKINALYIQHLYITKINVLYSIGSVTIQKHSFLLILLMGQSRSVAVQTLQLVYDLPLGPRAIYT